MPEPSDSSDSSKRSCMPRQIPRQGIPAASAARIGARSARKRRRRGAERSDARQHERVLGEGFAPIGGHA